MVPRLMRDSGPAGCASEDTRISMGDNESALILIRHCNDMKQQEARLRLVTLLVLLASMALVLFTSRFHPWHQGDFAPAQKAEAVGPSTALLSQDKACQPGPAKSDLSVTSQRWSVHFNSLHMNTVSDEQYIWWEAEPRKPHTKNIVIPLRGFYFVYFRTTLRCHNPANDADYVRFKLELHSWNEGYNQTIPLAEAWDGADCSQGSDVSRHVFVGQIFDLLEGDHVSVYIKHGSTLVTESFFGAYVT